MSSHRASTFESATKALRKSAGILCTVPPETFVGICLSYMLLVNIKNAWNRLLVISGLGPQSHELKIVPDEEAATQPSRIMY